MYSGFFISYKIISFENTILLHIFNSMNNICYDIDRVKFIMKGATMAIIGIDLGTSNSAAAVLRGGKPVIIPSTEGISLSGKAFPSYVAITADGNKLVGEPARRQAAENPEGTAYAFKRKMGKREKVNLRDKEFTPEQLSAFLLQKIKNDAEAFLGEPVEKAVVTVPAYLMITKEVQQKMPVRSLVLK